MLNNILHHLAQITVDLERIITVDARNKVWAFSKVDLILFAPLDPFVIFIARLHFKTSSILAQPSRESFLRFGMGYDTSLLNGLLTARNAFEYD